MKNPNCNSQIHHLNSHSFRWSLDVYIHYIFYFPPEPHTLLDALLRPCIGVRVWEYPLLYFKPSEIDRDPQSYITFNSGKSCIMLKKRSELQQCLNTSPIYIMLFDFPEKNRKPILVGAHGLMLKNLEIPTSTDQLQVCSVTG